MDFRIWGRIETIAPDDFFVIVSAMQKDSTTDGTGGTSSRWKVRTEHRATFDEAKAMRDQLMKELAELITARGDRVVEVQAEP